MRFRLYPTPPRAETLAGHCADARYLRNLAEAWVAEGSVTVQQQALRDFARAWSNFFAGTHHRPTWRRKGTHEGFRIVALQPDHVRRVNRHWGRVWVPKAGWVRFRMSRPVPASVKSFRVTLKGGRWHIAFTVKAEPVAGPGDGSLLGIDRGVVIPLACSDQTSCSVPGLGTGSGGCSSGCSERSPTRRRGQVAGAGRGCASTRSRGERSPAEGTPSRRPRRILPGGATSSASRTSG